MVGTPGQWVVDIGAEMNVDGFGGVLRVGAYFCQRGRTGFGTGLRFESCFIRSWCLNKINKKSQDVVSSREILQTQVSVFVHTHGPLSYMSKWMNMDNDKKTERN